MQYNLFIKRAAYMMKQDRIFDGAVAVFSVIHDDALVSSVWRSCRMICWSWLSNALNI